jgi:conjugal transfer ATP-binding protein TraC
MSDNQRNQSNLSPNANQPIYNPEHIGQNLQSNTTVVGAYGQYGPRQNVNQTQSVSKPNINQGVEMHGLHSQRTKDIASHFSSVAHTQQVSPQGSNLAHPSGPGTQAYAFPPQNLTQSPQTYINNSVNQYRRPIAPPQNRAQSINSQQVFPVNQSPYAKGSIVQGQRPNLPANKSTPPQKRGLFSSFLRSPQPQQQIQSNQRLVDKNSVEYLRKLSPAELRKEVIDTEIEIQKTLIESEKAYREGVTTIRDLIAPSSLKVTSGSLEIGTKLIRTFFVLTYPRIINSGWLEGVVNADVPMDLSLFIYPRDSTEVLRELKSKVGKIQASLQLNSEKGAARDPQLETAYRDVEGLRDAIQQGVEKFFKVGVYISIYADNVDQLEKYSQTVESVLAQQSIIMKRAALQMDDGFNSSLPILKDDLNVLNNMNTSPLSASFPFVSSELSSNDGILYGVNRHNNSLIIFDRFDLENANSLIFATSGAGKSYTVKLEILRSLMLGVSVIVIDPEQEYKLLCDKLGGVYINFSLNSVNRINPFDLPKALPGESTGDILRSAIVDLMGLMNLMLGKLNPTEESIMERAIKEVYAKRDITENANLNTVVSPTMSDLVEILEGIIGGESLAQRLYKYTDGTFAGIFNQRSNVDINNSFVVFNIRDLQETLRPIAMYVLLKFIWNEIRSKLKKRIVAVDEAWIMMQYEDSARFLYGLVKRARKYYLGVTTITQDVGDFLNSPFGKPIVTNAAMKILLKQSSAAIDTIADTFALTSGEKQVLLQSEVGQGIFFAGPRHVAIDIIAFPREHMIITTNPKELLKQQGLDEAGDAIIG